MRQITERWIKLRNEELHCLYFSSNIIGSTFHRLDPLASSDS